ncbi:hypothetical protein GBK04_26120 [Cytophagaceae bacterium SJW1-29]|uniref:Uncharacterized protein n=1 Tax=Salmonirosea aquatica TaxID=2654236 RepID=A0A7C9BL83_9BACT|nr:hypothetical protein [Cytophagaceae bacterium SJW1-29]
MQVVGVEVVTKPIRPIKKGKQAPVEGMEQTWEAVAATVAMAVVVMVPGILYQDRVADCFRTVPMALVEGLYFTGGKHLSTGAQGAVPSMV